jgi:hypothetical protein
MNTMHVDDFVVLGRTVPEESKKYGKRVCMAGYSPENNQFLRVYPLRVPVGENADANSFKARHSYSLDLRRNPQDSRAESWRVADEQKPTSTPWDRAAEISKKTVVDWLTKRAVDSIHVLNQCRLSIGVILAKADDWEGIVVPRTQPDASEEHRTLFDDLEDQTDIDANQIQFAPYIRFRDAHGDHQIQVREWGAYLLLSNPKYSSQPEVLWGAPGYRSGHDLVLVVGNMGNHRGNWLIIKTFEIEQQPVDDGMFAGMWPE